MLSISYAIKVAAKASCVMNVDVPEKRASSFLFDPALIYFI